MIEPTVVPAAPMAVPRTAPAPAGVDRRTTILFAAFVGAHVVLALIIRVSPVLADVHALACMLGGVLVAARHVRRVPHVLAYIASSEVLWRMVKAPLPYEFGKYLVCLIAVVTLARIGGRRNRGLAIIYIALLLPSAVLTLTGADFDMARQLVAFNLSGPVCLALCIWVSSNIRIQDADISKIFLIAIGPVAGIATLGLLSVATHEITYINASNTIAAGGFGPNQVSAVVGLVIDFSLLLVTDRRTVLPARLALVGLVVFFAVQSALTFSRSGLAMAFAAFGAAMFYYARDRRMRVTLVLVALVLFGLGKYVVVPGLQDLTNGKFGQRYSEVESDGRTQLARLDLVVFEDNPLLGVGPGMATRLRAELGHFGVAHNEFTRLLSEHGVPGVLAILVLCLAAWRMVRAARILRYRALVVALLTWAGLFLMVSAMRLAAPSVVAGLACTIAYSFRQQAPPRKGRRRA